MRVLVVSLALLWWGCSIYSPFGIDNPESCRPHPELCAAGTSCDQGLGRCVATSDPQPTPDPPVALSGLQVIDGSISPAFAPDTTQYIVSVSPLVNMVQLVPTAAAGISIAANGAPVTSGSSFPVYLMTSGTTVTIVVRRPGQPDKIYRVTVLKLSAAYLKASNPGGADAMGTSVSLSGDTLAVGAPGEASNALGVNDNQADNSMPNAGAVYVFVRDNTGWKQQAYVKALNTKTNQQFGYSVALEGDNLVVGAPGEASASTDPSDASAAAAGAVYVFQRTGTTWMPKAYLKASNPSANAVFGISVALSVDTLAVGASQEAGSGMGITVNTPPPSYNRNNSGAVYVFKGEGTTWVQQAYIKASNADTGDRFGTAVALSGDTLAVGAYAEDSNGIPGDNNAGGAGAVYVFQRSGASWTEQAYVKPNVIASGSLFGRGVSLAGETLVVGAPGEDGKSVDVNGDPQSRGYASAGAAYVFQRTGATWTQQHYLKANNTAPEAQFGGSVALSGDTLVVGASGEGGAGAAYRFQRTGGAWAQTAYIKSLAPDMSDTFGSSVSVSGDSLACGVPNESSKATGVDGNYRDNGLPFAGAVYVFR